MYKAFTKHAKCVLCLLSLHEKECKNASHNVLVCLPDRPTCVSYGPTDCSKIRTTETARFDVNVWYSMRRFTFYGMRMLRDSVHHHCTTL